MFRKYVLKLESPLFVLMTALHRFSVNRLVLLKVNSWLKVLSLLICLKSEVVSCTTKSKVNPYLGKNSSTKEK